MAYLDPGTVEDHVPVGELRAQVFSIELLAVLVPLHTVQLKKIILIVAMEQKLQDRLPVCHIPNCKENPIYAFPEKELRGPQSQFQHLCVSKRFAYSQDRSTYFLAAEYRQTDRGNV